MPTREGRSDWPARAGTEERSTHGAIPAAIHRSWCEAEPPGPPHLPALATAAPHLGRPAHRSRRFSCEVMKRRAIRANELSDPAVQARIPLVAPRARWDLPLILQFEVQRLAPFFHRVL